MIKPIVKIDLDQCPNCFAKHSLSLYEKEEEFRDLNQYGIPNAGTTEYDCQIVCTECGDTFDCKKIGMHFIIDFNLPKINKIMKDYNPFQKEY